MFHHRTRIPFRASTAIAAGDVTPARLRGPEFVALFRGVYVGSSVIVDTQLRAEALALRAGDGAVLAGPFAAVVHGADCPWDDAEVVVPSNRRLAREGVTVRLDHLARWEITRHRAGFRLTSPARTAFDLARREAPLADRVAAADALAHVCGFGVPALREIADRHPAVRGSVAAREVLGLVDPRAESLMETRVRLVVLQAGLPAPVPQWAVFLPSGTRIRLDLAWPEAKVALEYDGEEHRSPDRHAKDLERAAGLQELGWQVLHVTARQVYRAPGNLTRRIALLLAA